MRSGWGSIKLGDVAQVNPEQLGSRTDPSYRIEYLDIAAIEQPGVIGASQSLTFAEAPSRARRRARAGDILVSTVRPYLRNFARVRDSFSNLVASTGYAVVRPRDGIDGGFLYQHVLSDDFVEFLKPRMSGSNYPAVRGSDVEAYTFSLPPLPEQRKIAAILSSVDDAIEKTRAVIDQVQVVKRGLMQELLTRGLPGQHTRFKPTEIGETPEEWKILTLADIVTIVSGGTPSRSRPAYWDGDVPWATPTDVTGLSGRIISETASWISEAGLANSSAVLLPPNSLLMTTRATIGACAINRISMATNQGFQNLVPMQGTCVAFLYYVIQRHTRRLERLAAGSTFLEVSKRTIRSFRIPFPPLPEQRKIAAILSSVDDTIEENQTLMDRLRVLKSALMSTLLTGELRVTPRP